MPVLNADVPRHFYCMVRSEYLHNLESHRDKYEQCAVFGIASEQNRTLGFHVHLQSGAVYWRLPIQALCWKPGKARPLRFLCPWDCFGYDVTTTLFTYLRDRDGLVRFGPRVMRGEYVFTVDWYANGYSDTPDQNKCAHILALEDGNYTAQPNNKILWEDLSFTSIDKPPRYRVNTHKWHGETHK